MKFEYMSVHAIAGTLGDRLKTARLNADLTQEQLAAKSGVSKKAIINCEQGKSKLETIIAVLLGLDISEQLNSFIPPQEISPIQLAKMQGKQRKRASGATRLKNKHKDGAAW